MLRMSTGAAVLGALLIAPQAGPPAVPPKAAAANPSPQKPPAKTAPRTNASAATLQDFLKQVDGYVAVHKKQEATLPGLSKQTTPQEIDAHQRALARLIQQARKNAKPGDLFTPAMQRLVRTLLRPIFSGKGGPQIKSEILDKEYKGNVTLAVNGRYPDDVPVSTMPPQVLESLPKLPEELEYRFIQDHLILFDTHAHIIADFMDRAFN
jgi:hypothetical protein